MDNDHIKRLFNERRRAMVCLDGYIDTRKYNVKNLTLASQHNSILWHERLSVTKELLATTGIAIILVSSIGKITASAFYEIIEQRELSVYNEEISDYNVVIKKTADFVRSLNPANALECCNIIKLMLSDGFFVGENSNYYNMGKINEARSFEGMTITTGNGVCRHNSDFLRDIMIALGYEAYSISNTMYSDNEKKGLLSNHRYTLIYDDGKYFIFDATNDGYMEFNGINYAQNVAGGIKSDIRLFQNWLYSSIDVQTIIKMFINSLANKDEYDSKELENSISQAFDKLYYNSEKLINLHYDIQPYLQNIRDGLIKKSNHR